MLLEQITQMNIQLYNQLALQTNTYFDLLVKGFDYQSGGYDAATTYNIGDVVRYISSSYVMLKDRQINVTPGTDGTVWQLIAQGDSGAVLNTRGDLLIQDASQTTRLPIGVVGSVLTTDGTDPIWSNAEGRNVNYVANSGSNSNPGTQFLPFTKHFITHYNKHLQEMLLTLVQLQVVQAVLQALTILHKQVQLVQVQALQQELLLRRFIYTNKLQLQMVVQATQLVMLLHLLTVVLN
jgi:hypothetical protein